MAGMHAIVLEAPRTARVTRYPLAHANQALADLRDGRLQGAVVLVPSSS